MSGWTIRAADGGFIFAVRVVPRASRNAIAGLHGDELKVQLTAPPVEGAANAALIAYLAERLGVRRSAVTIVGGDKSRRKQVRVEGVGRDAIERLLR